MENEVPASTTTNAGLPVDGHVHFHSLAQVPLTLNCAAENFRRLNRTSGGLSGALLLTQSAGEQVFEQLRRLDDVEGWTLATVDGEDQSLLATDTAGRELLIVNGRQVRADCGLETLALGTCLDYPDGLEFELMVRTVQESGALTVIPWGFGKWTGRRGGKLRAVLEQAPPQSLFLGDNGGRPLASPMPPILAEYQHKGFRVLPGSDPFPFNKDYRRVGGIGFLAEGNSQPMACWRTLRRCIEERRQSPARFGAGIGMIRFVANNVGIQLYNRWRRRH